MLPLNLTQEQYRSLRDLIKSELTLDSPGLRGPRPPYSHIFDTWFKEFLVRKIVPEFFSNEEGVYWDRSSIMITRAVRKCVLKMSCGMRRSSAVREYLQRNLPTTAADATFMETVSPCYFHDAANLQVQDEHFYPEENALSPEEGHDPLGGFEEYLANGGGDVQQGCFAMSDAEFVSELFRDGGFAYSDIAMEGSDYGSGNGVPSFTFETEDGVVQASWGFS
ncbi:hypothetical protein HOY82DRAFT_546820 [Tuber indicum]|nr:hypothetical protein HOY82DRAFT_546820 [Tuber indicum]